MHLTDEFFAELIDGRADAARREEGLRHLADCDECLEVYAVSIRHLREERGLWSVVAPFRDRLAGLGLTGARGWVAAAACAVAALSALAYFATRPPGLAGWDQPAGWWRQAGAVRVPPVPARPPGTAPEGPGGTPAPENRMAQQAPTSTTVPGTGHPGPPAAVLAALDRTAGLWEKATSSYGFGGSLFKSGARLGAVMEDYRTACAAGDAARCSRLHALAAREARGVLPEGDNPMGENAALGALAFRETASRLEKRFPAGPALDGYRFGRLLEALWLHAAGGKVPGKEEADTLLGMADVWGGLPGPSRASLEKAARSGDPSEWAAVLWGVKELL